RKPPQPRHRRARGGAPAPRAAARARRCRFSWWLWASPWSRPRPSSISAPLRPVLPWRTSRAGPPPPPLPRWGLRAGPPSMRPADQCCQQKAGQHRAFQSQHPRQRGAAAALEHDGKNGGGHGGEQEYRNREQLRERTLLVRDHGRGREHEATGDLRNEQPEQRQNGKTVEKSGTKAQERRDDRGRDHGSNPSGKQRVSEPAQTWAYCRQLLANAAIASSRVGS